jgi:DNA-binding NtrC family response regulator
MSHNTAEFGAPEWRAMAALAVPSRHGLICVSSAMSDLVDALERLASYRCPVLIAGESGSGKDTVAEALHLLGPRRDGPLIKFSCASLAMAGTPMQLFGAVERVFGGASTFTPGCFQYADGGSLLLDDVDELPLWLQGKLLHAVENPEVQPVGSVTTVNLDVRLIAATNRDLAAMVKAGSFRPDLYYRLLGASLRVPALRERTADLEPLIAELVAGYNRAFDKRVNAISSAALTLIRAYRWPGNLREVAHALEWAMLMCDDDRIDVRDLPSAITESFADTPLERSSAPSEDRDRVTGVFDQHLRVSMTAGLLDDALKEAVERSLEAADGDCGKAASMLGVSRAALYHKMVRFGLTRPPSHHAAAMQGDGWGGHLAHHGEPQVRAESDAGPGPAPSPGSYSLR